MDKDEDFWISIENDGERAERERKEDAFIMPLCWLLIKC